MRRRRGLVALFAVLALGLTAAPALGTFPFPGGSPPGSNVYDYTRLHITNGACPPGPGSDLPKGFDCKNSFKLTDYAPQPGDQDYDPTVENNPQELFGVKGPGTNHAWELTTGRPDTLITVMDSGIEWNTPELANKVHLNMGELPVPCTSSTCTTTYGSTLQDYDVNHDGVFNVQDYAHDPRVTDANHNGILDPEDLILAFSDGVDNDHNGYVDDIAGWDFYQADNDPADDVTYGHGTGEARDSSAEIEKQLTQCPNCMVEPLRVGDSFIADINHWAQAVYYAVDNGASLIQEALGTIDHTAFAQAAADYAYAHGVLVVASEADESAGHHNYPAALNHTMVVNSVTPAATAGDIPGAGSFLPGQVQGVPIQHPATFLAFNGCTNFGGYTWVSIESSSCSSDATGQSSGMAGLLYSEARNAVQKGIIAPDSSGRPLSAEEAKQLFRLGADDIDFSTPRCDPAPKCGPPNNFATTLPDSQRFITTAGWDQISGWGRFNSNKALHLVADGKIPPEADITSPSWWQPLPTAGRIDIVGRVAAPRASSYTYEVQFAPGVQPPRWPLSDTWTTVANGAGTTPKQGVLTRLNLDQVRAAIDKAPPVYTPADDPTSRDLPEKDAFRVRVVVHADGDTTTPWKTAIEQRQYFSHADPDLLGAFPKSLNADGASAPAFADIDGDGVNELVMADGNGLVHAFKNDGSEVKGWPVHTNRLNLSETQTGGHTVYGPVLLGSPTVADLDGDGWPEISAADTEGYLYVWEHDGKLRKGFPVQVNRAYSEAPGCQSWTPDPAPMPVPSTCLHPVRDHVNTVDHAFTSNPAAGKLDSDPAHPGLDLVAGANDGHVYAWHADGTPVPGWPVMLRDPAKVASVDPVTHFITFKPGANAKYGRQELVTPTIADINGDGVPEVIANVDEEYKEAPNVSAARNPTYAALASQLGGNTRVYALYHDGTNHPGTAKVANLGDNAYVKGWPVKIAMLETELLPDVGSGSDGPPIVGDVDGDGKPEIVTSSIASPPYVLNPDGTSKYGNGPDGTYITAATEQTEFKNPTATDGPSVGAVGGMAIGHLGGSSGPASIATGAAGLKRVLDILLPEQQLGAEDHVDAWNGATGTFDPGFPAQMNDLQFFTTPAIADVDGDGRAEVLQSSAVYDLRAYGLGGAAPSGWPKFTGGWSVMTPAVGDFNGDGKADVALATREGNLFVWRTAGDACQTPEWPKYQHDLHNSGDARTDATPPGVLKDVSLDGSTLRFTTSGGDGPCGQADSFRVTVDGNPVAIDDVPAPSGAQQTLELGDLGHGRHTVTVQTVDEAGNASIPVTVRS